MMESIENEKEKEKEKKTKKKDVTDSRVCMTNCQQFGVNNPSTLRLFEQDKD